MSVRRNAFRMGNLRLCEGKVRIYEENVRIYKCMRKSKYLLGKRFSCRKYQTGNRDE